MTPKRTAAAKVTSLADLADIRRALRERERAAAEEARRAAQAEAERLAQREAFARAVGPVRPLRAPLRVVHVPPRPTPHPHQRRLDDQAVLREAMSDEFDPLTLLETDERLSFRRPGIGPDVLRKLRRGAWVVQGQIDLHGHTKDAAREAIGAFLQEAAKQGWRCVRVVHGKGLGSPGRQPVLKTHVPRWLAQRQEVLAYTLARGPDGGAGALIVLLDARQPGRAAG